MLFVVCYQERELYIRLFFLLSVKILTYVKFRNKYCLNQVKRTGLCSELYLRFYGKKEQVEVQ